MKLQNQVIKNLSVDLAKIWILFKIVMNDKTKFILALIQIENLSQIVKDNQYEHFFVSHLVPIKIELERQLSLIKK
jgi:hypothetical protein